MKNAVGPKRMDRGELPAFVDDYYSAHGDPIKVPLELAQQGDGDTGAHGRHGQLRVFRGGLAPPMIKASFKSLERL
ncbi:hypothetical protein WEI85_41965, partial [Actinomycetes bacterium KLBMP 9797]